jgi:hypothetical protein
MLVKIDYVNFRQPGRKLSAICAAEMISDRLLKVVKVCAIDGAPAKKADQWMVGHITFTSFVKVLNPKTKEAKKWLSI